MPPATRLRALCLIPLLCLALGSVRAGEAQGTPDLYFVADITLQTDAEFRNLLERAEQLLLAGVPLPEARARVTFVLHGPVINALLRQHYLDNKPLADLAARLSALQVIEVKACRQWMGSHGIAETELLPFIEPVALGPELVRELVHEHHYLYF